MGQCFADRGAKLVYGYHVVMVVNRKAATDIDAAQCGQAQPGDVMDELCTAFDGLYKFLGFNRLRTDMER